MKNTIDLSKTNIDHMRKESIITLLKNTLHKVSYDSKIGKIKLGSPDNVRSVINTCPKLLQQIESQIMYNNQDYTLFPNDLVHGLLSAHVYTDDSQNAETKVQFEGELAVYNSIMENWYVAKTYQDKNGYNATLYYNKITKSLVLSHRGTTADGAQDLWQDSETTDTGADINGIVSRKITPQQKSAFCATKDVIQIRDKMISQDQYYYSLSFTGHSLGAWLAEQSVFFCHKDFNFNCSDKTTKAVVFDSPGAHETLAELMESDVMNHGIFSLSDLNIIAYLSPPNIINTIQRHIGTVYQIPTDVGELAKQIAEKTNDYTSYQCINKMITCIFGSKTKDTAFATLDGHFLKNILETFDKNTGLPKFYQEAVRWPWLEFNGKLSQNNTTIGSILYKIFVSYLVQEDVTNKLDYDLPDASKWILPLVSVIPDIFSYIQKDKCSVDVLSILQAVHNGEFQIEELVKLHELALEHDAKGEDTISTIFDKRYSGSYHTKAVNLYKCKLNPNNRLDDCLKELSAIPCQELECRISDPLLFSQLQNLKLQYTLNFNDQEIIAQNNITTIGQIKDSMFRLLYFYPDILQDLQNPLAQFDASNEPINVSFNDGDCKSSDLVAECANYSDD